MSNLDIFTKAQGRAAMMGFMAIISVYAVTGTLLPGVV
tara:strand:+ start:130 stop:243 length:114 start_codon:yes stop_codon:yes gene_type:complete